MVTIKAFLLGLILLLTGCCSYSAQFTGWVITETGKYRTHRVDCCRVQEIYEAYGGNPRLEVEGCTIWTRKEIFYCTTKALMIELENIQSFKNLRGAAIRDIDSILDSQIANHQ